MLANSKNKQEMNIIYPYFPNKKTIIIKMYLINLFVSDNSKEGVTKPHKPSMAHKSKTSSYKNPCLILTSLNIIADIKPIVETNTLGIWIADILITSNKNSTISTWANKNDDKFIVIYFWRPLLKGVEDNKQNHVGIKKKDRIRHKNLTNREKVPNIGFKRNSSICLVWSNKFEGVIKALQELSTNITNFLFNKEIHAISGLSV